MLRIKNPRSLVALFTIAILLLLTACEAPFSAERQYLSTMFRHAGSTLKTLNTLQELAGRVDFGDDAWENSMNREMDKLRNLIAEARAITPPDRFANVHTSYLDIMDTLEEMVKTYDQAMELRNHEYIQRGNELLRQAEQAIERVKEEIRKLSEQLNQ